MEWVITLLPSCRVYTSSEIDSLNNIQSALHFYEGVMRLSLQDIIGLVGASMIGWALDGIVFKVAPLPSDPYVLGIGILLVVYNLIFHTPYSL